jgi:hypothetical protein
MSQLKTRGPKTRGPKTRGLKKRGLKKRGPKELTDVQDFILQGLPKRRPFSPKFERKLNFMFQCQHANFVREALSNSDAPPNLEFAKLNQFAKLKIKFANLTL